MLIRDLLIRRKDDHKVAIKCGDSEISYKNLYKKAFDLSEWFGEKVPASQNVGIFLPNSIQYAIAYFSITFKGRTIIPINVKAKWPEFCSTLEYCGINIVITNRANKEIIRKFSDNYKGRLYVLNIDDNICEIMGSSIMDEAITDTKQQEIEQREDDVAIMLHTSGTTSTPKKVMLTHRNLISNIESNIRSLQLSANDKVLIALPMFFGYCNTSQFLTHIYLGATIVIMDEIFFPKTFFEIVSQERVTNFTGVPSMLLMLLTYRYRDRFDISSLRYICFGGGNMPVEKLKELIDAFPGVGFVQTYGQTEASPRVTALLPDKAIEKIGSIGKAIPGVKVRIVNEDGHDVKNGEIGEIIVNGSNVMKGYYKRPEETARVIKNGWLHTGDLGYFDEDGYIYLVGRIKNIIISGGLNIYPEEIEELLMCHPYVKEVLVYKQPHEMLGEKPVARVVLKEGSIVKPDDLIDYCAKLLAEYKVPDKIYIVNEIPKTSTGKIKRQ